MTEPFTFPATPEAFIAFQEQLINRPLTENEKEVTAVWLEIINGTVTGELDRGTVLEDLDQLIDQSEDGQIRRFLEGVRHWLR